MKRYKYRKLFLTKCTDVDNLHNKTIKHRKTLYFKPCPRKCKMRTAVHTAVKFPYKRKVEPET